VNREFFINHPDKFDPIIPGKEYMESMEKFYIEKFELLKSNGKANEIKSKI
jgi:fructose-bisphosphate aldolase class II